MTDDAGRCETCNGGRQLYKCRGCETVFRHINKYSDCGNARCEGEESDPVPCPDCAATDDADRKVGERWVRQHGRVWQVMERASHGDDVWLGTVDSEELASLLAHGAADAARLTAERDALAAALAPFAAVRLPDSWPAECVVDWRESVGNDGHRFAAASYLGIDAQGGPTVADYRAAALAGRGRSK